MNQANHGTAAPMHRSRRFVLGALAGLTGCFVLPMLAACDAVFDTDMANLEADMQDSFRRRHMKISKFMLTRDSRYQVSGMIYIDVEFLDGVKTFYVPCVAKMDPQSRHFTWSCERLP